MKGSSVRLRLAGFGAVLCLGLGCGVDDSPPPEYQPRTAVRAYCDAICESTDRCIEPVYDTCTDACVADLGEQLSWYDPRLLAATADCMLSRPCSEVQYWEHELLCWDQAAASLEPGEAVVEFCEAFSPAMFNCGYWADLEWCVEEFKLSNPQIMNDARDCFSGSPSCQEVEGCLDTVFVW
jgi:hypothetical protein